MPATLTATARPDATILPGDRVLTDLDADTVKTVDYVTDCEYRGTIVVFDAETGDLCLLSEVLASVLPTCTDDDAVLDQAFGV